MPLRRSAGTWFPRCRASPSRACRHAAVHAPAAAGCARHPPQRSSSAATWPKRVRSARAGNAAALAGRGHSWWVSRRSRPGWRKAARRTSVRMGAYFAVALAVGLAALGGGGAAAAAPAAAFARRAGAACRHRAARHRQPVPPGSQATAVLVALGRGGDVHPRRLPGAATRCWRRCADSAPPGMPNVFLLDIPGRRDGAAVCGAGRARNPASERPPEIAAAVAMRADRRGWRRPSSKMGLTAAAGRRFMRTRAVTWLRDEAARHRGAGRPLVGPGAYARRPQVCVQRGGRPHAASSHRAPCSNGTPGAASLARAGGMHPARPNPSAWPRASSSSSAPARWTGLPAIYYGRHG